MAHSARRCGECHEPYLADWQASPHARAARSPVYRAMRERAPEPSACDRCHAPLAAVLAPADPLADEGVSCEVCHGIADVAVGPAAAEWSLHIAENRKYGPLCGDVQPTYFHRTGCSPLHTESRLCAACHHLAQAAPDGRLLPVFSEFEEWQHGSVTDAGLPCQGCHMPEARAQVASGGDIRGGVSSHRFATPDRMGAIEATLGRDADGQVVVVTLRNDGAPHAIPTGLPGRRLELRAVLVDAHGAALAEAVAAFTRVLVDADGREVPFFAAVREAEDSRLRPGEARVVALRLPAGGVAALLTLVDVPLAPAIAAAIAVPPPPPRTLQTLRLTPGDRRR